MVDLPALSEDRLVIFVRLSIFFVHARMAESKHQESSKLTLITLQARELWYCRYRH